MAFLKANGTRFYRNGKPSFLFGATVYGATNSTVQFGQRLADALSANMNIIRIVNYMAANEYDEPTWQRVDSFCDQCRQAGIMLLIDLSDYWGILNGRGTGTGSQDWTTFLTFLTSRVNTVNGLIYKNDDAIGLFSIAGELSSPDAPTVNAFYIKQSAIFKALDTNHIINPGGIYIPPDSVAQISTLDCLCAHTYAIDPGIEHDVIQMGKLSVQYNKPWFTEEFGQPQTSGQLARAAHMRLLYAQAIENGCSGMMYWNLGLTGNSGTSYDVNYNTPEPWSVVQTFGSIFINY